MGKVEGYFGVHRQHEWKLDADGEIDTFAWDASYHNGPSCTVCYESFCIHCEWFTQDRWTERCEG
jgi:hypothetical protein